MKIAILTSGRFHVCDLARELSFLGHDVSFYSCVPKSRTRRFGLPDHCNKPALLPLVPLFVATRKAQGTRYEERMQRLFISALDFLASQVILECDVFIGMSGMSTRTAKKMKRQGAQIWIERGSRHILSQKAILCKLSPQTPISKWVVGRESADYRLADTIVVPSRHVVESFIDEGIAGEKLFRNPYGVDLGMFTATPVPRNKQKIVLFVGTWSLRKGCDLLWAACKRAQSWRLLHVGQLGDAVVPSSELFEHIEPVPQWTLIKYFGYADVFVLASREEGLALVQAQALAAGLPVVCTDRTGGEDLRDMLVDPRWLSVIPHDDLDALSSAIDGALQLTKSLYGKRELLAGSRDSFSWKAYGQRYSNELALRQAN
jgi:starch synthase